MLTGAERFLVEIGLVSFSKASIRFNSIEGMVSHEVFTESFDNISIISNCFNMEILAGRIV